ncbi:class GN sortase [Desulfosediminicola sp.]|uniref:class GN sortase n=1 Tax=Desulfosediminicola sp. TaxID=2886825 RepID=UPI003AF2CEDE
MGKMILQVTTYLLLVGGGLLICDGMWLRAKALLAQKMLQHAWEETVRTGVAVKPWPWADSWPVARLKVERLGVDHIVLEGDSGEVLAFGPGRLTASSLPGSGGNCILSGHRDTSFAFLQELKEGDVVVMDSMRAEQYRFEVLSARVEEAVGLYLERPEEPWLTMITCYPFDAIEPGTNQRYVVFARLIKSEPAELPAKTAMQPDAYPAMKAAAFHLA